MPAFIKTPDGGVTITPALISPLVYLDYCVIADLAGTETGERFRERILQQGTLYLSWAHFIELFSLGPGFTFDKVAAYLRSFGDRFIVIDADANAVVKRERAWAPERQNPAIDLDWLALIAAKWSISNEEASIGVLLDYMAGEPELVKGIKTLHASYKEKIKILFDDQRTRYQADKNAKKLLAEIEYAYEPPFLTNKVNLELMRECIRTNEQFNPSDGLDFHHAVVSISYCDVVVLDKKWARRCRSLKLPKETASVFDGTEMDRVLAHLGNCAKPK